MTIHHTINFRRLPSDIEGTSRILNISGIWYNILYINRYSWYVDSGSRNNDSATQTERYAKGREKRFFVEHGNHILSLFLLFITNERPDFGH